jgi:hypothetical protein
MEPSERAQYIANMARQLGIALPEEEMARVQGVFANLERAAELLRDTEIGDETIAAAVFCPRPGA